MGTGSVRVQIPAIPRRRERVFSSVPFWAARADVRHLLPGDHLLAVRAGDGRGNTFMERVEFRT